MAEVFGADLVEEIFGPGAHLPRNGKVGPEGRRGEEAGEDGVEAGGGECGCAGELGGDDAKAAAELCEIPAAAAEDAETGGETIGRDGEGVELAGDGFEEGGFATAVRAEDGEVLSREEVEVDVVEDGRAAAGDKDVLEGEDGRGHGRSLLRIKERSGSREGECALERAAVCSGAELAEELLGDGVTLTGGVFEALAVGDFDFAAMVVNEAGSLEDTGCEGDGGAAGADHFGEKLLGELEAQRADAIGDHEEPAGEALFDAMEAVAGGDLAGEHAGVLDLLKDEGADGLVTEEIFLKATEVDTECGSGDLDEAVVDAAYGAEEVKGFGDAFAADEADLDAVSIGHAGDDGGDT